MSWNDGVTRPVSLELLGQRYRRYRLADPEAEEAMAGSLRRWGQLSPVVACVRDEKLELLDGRRTIKWEGLAEIPLTRILEAAAEKLPLELAVAFLKRALVRGRVPTATLVRMAVKEHISVATLVRARNALGTESVREGKTHYCQLPVKSAEPAPFDQIGKRQPATHSLTQRL